MSKVTVDIKLPEKPPKPIGRYLLLRVENKLKTEGGIYLPDSQKKTGNFSSEDEIYVEAVSKAYNLNDFDYNIGDRVVVEINADEPVAEKKIEEEDKTIFWVLAEDHHIKGVYDEA